MFAHDEFIKSVQVEFEKWQVANTLRVSAPLLERNAKLHPPPPYASYVVDSLVFGISSWILKGQLETEHRTFTYDYPANWFEHLKETMFPKLPWKLRMYLLKKFPIMKDQRTFVHPVSIARVCPHSTEDWSKSNRKHVAWLARLDYQ